MVRVGLTVERLVEGGAELADEIGFEHLTGAALARKFGVKLASLYSHLKNLDDLKSQIALLALRQLADATAQAMAGRAGKDALIALANAHRDYALRCPGRFTAARHPLSPEMAAASAGPQLAQLMRAVLHGYAVPESEQVHAIRFLGGFFMGYITLTSSSAFAHSAPDADVSWQRCLDALDTSLRQWPATPPLPTGNH
ncbi:TetR family transcriptional regulator [Pandoraea pneumonica]|jgi:AcrR family transcriptional regulator|uniref:TetR family transcriptional regulator n=1 Tax=Pandoraea pneumonica TaxID=2508299 RepID=A0A5E4SAH7_9BURK|nr:TetR/AcrR family transcriptional regulator [Pandoraea pneumonica]VVD72141.1 TetR family transcriptional regulator [Pandoraea pneumonica]